MQAARDGLANLHGEPQQAKKVKPDPEASDDSLHTHGQQEVLDSLVRPHLSNSCYLASVWALNIPLQSLTWFLGMLCTPRDAAIQLTHYVCR